MDIPDFEHDVHKLLADISNEWYTVGLPLKVDTDFLESLESSPKKEIVKLSKVIHKWITTESSPVNWSTLIEAIEGDYVKNKQKANKIREHINKGKNAYLIFL